MTTTRPGRGAVEFGEESSLEKPGTDGAKKSRTYVALVHLIVLAVVRTSYEPDPGCVAVVADRQHRRETHRLRSRQVRESAENTSLLRPAAHHGVGSGGQRYFESGPDDLVGISLRTCNKRYKLLPSSPALTRSTVDGDGEFHDDQICAEAPPQCSCGTAQPSASPSLISLTDNRKVGVNENTIVAPERNRERKCQHVRIQAQPGQVRHGDHHVFRDEASQNLHASLCTAINPSAPPTHRRAPILPS